MKKTFCVSRLCLGVVIFSFVGVSLNGMKRRSEEVPFEKKVLALFEQKINGLISVEDETALKRREKFGRVIACELLDPLMRKKDDYWKPVMYKGAKTLVFESLQIDGSEELFVEDPNGKKLFKAFWLMIDSLRKREHATRMAKDFLQAVGVKTHGNVLRAGSIAKNFLKRMLFLIRMELWDDIQKALYLSKLSYDEECEKRKREEMMEKGDEKEKDSDGVACVICYLSEEELMSEYGDNGDLRRQMVRLDCDHVFCAECFGQWKEKKTCPVCRHEFQEKNYVSDSDGYTPPAPQQRPAPRQRTATRQDRRPAPAQGVFGDMPETMQDSQRVNRQMEGVLRDNPLFGRDNPFGNFNQNGGPGECRNM